MIKDLLKNNILLSIGSIIALFINLISMPIITRIYSPGDIGTFAALHVFSLILFPILSMRMEIIFAQKIQISELKNLFYTTAVIGVTLAIISWLLLFLSAIYINQSVLINYLLLIVCLPVFLTYFEYGIGILNHLKLYKSIAIFSTLGIFFQKSIQIILGMLMQDKTSAIFLSYCIPTFTLAVIIFVILNNKINLFRNVKFSFNTIRHYSNHIFYRIAYSLSNLFKDRFIIILIIIYFSSDFAGLYSQAIGLLSIPAIIFSGPIKTIITREYKENNYSTISMVVLIYNLLIYLLLPLYIYLFFHSSSIFPIIFGEKWSELSSVFNILLIPMFILILSSSLDRLYDVLKAQKYAFFFELFFGFLCFSGFLIMSYSNYEFLDALKINAAILTLFFTTFTIFILKKAKQINPFIKTMKYFFYQTLFCTILFLIFAKSLIASTFLLALVILVGFLLIKNDLEKVFIS